MEKILEPGEQLPTRWRTHGTTGYDFMNQLNGLFVNTENAGVCLFVLLFSSIFVSLHFPLVIISLLSFLWAYVSFLVFLFFFQFFIYYS